VNEAELITTAQSNNSLFSQIFLNKQLEPIPKVEEPLSVPLTTTEAD
jgi:hypothetical protein